MVLAIDTTPNHDISVQLNYWYPRVTDASAKDVAAAFRSILTSVVTASPDSTVEVADTPFPL